MAPPFLPMAWTLIGAVCGAAVTVAWLTKFAAKPQGRSDCNFLLPRFFLILAVQENLRLLLAAVEPEETVDFCQTLVKTLRTVHKKLESLEGFINVLDYLDKELVPCLQRVPGGPYILEGYLPKAGQTWDALLGEKVEHERRFLEAENNDPANNDNELQEDMEMSCLNAIDGILEMLQDWENLSNDHINMTQVRSHAGPLTDSEVDGNDFGNSESPAGQYLLRRDGLQDRQPDSFIKITEISAAVLIQKYTVVKIFYATDRQVTEDGEYIGDISRREIISGHEESNGDHSRVGAAELLEVSPLQFGVAEVGIPYTHDIGGMEAPRHAYEESSPVKHVVILSVDTKMRGNREEFLSSVNGDWQQGDREGDLLIFIHGYNVSHKGALKRAAQLKYDLQFLGTVIAYSWSSKGKLYGYPHDEVNVEKTVRYLKSFLVSIMKEVEAPRVHILAHSMGNRALVGALNMLLEGKCFPSPRCRLSQIIFAAADERRSTFEKLLEKLSKGSMLSSPAPDSDGHTTTESNGVSNPREELLPHLTVYCSTDDWALTASRLYHGFKHRLGDTHSFLSVASASVDFHDVVDASGMDISSLHHSYYGDVPAVIQDLQVLLKSKIPASSRPNLHKITHLRRPFYALKKDKWLS